MLYCRECDKLTEGSLSVRLWPSLAVTGQLLDL